MRYCPSCGSRFSQEATFCPHDGSPIRELPDQEPAEDPLLGRVIDGRYRVERQIGEGGMGIVYLATHTVLGKKLALKVLRGEMARDADVVRRFIQEAQTASSIGHSNIVDISDFGRLDDGAVYFAMEYLDGDALTQLIGRGGSVPMREAIRIIEQMASALGAAHARGVVHRDMKPDNVFILRRGDDPVVKVLDFGIAKVGGAGAKLTKTGMVFGTPHYMSPEQAAGHAVDGRTDIYAVGVIMYEMFTGKVPFEADTFMGILTKHMFEQPVPPSQMVEGGPLGAIEDVILRALAKKPEQRYQTMEELLADLAAVRGGGTVAIGARSGSGASDELANALEPPSRTEMRLSHADGPSPRLPKSRTPLIAFSAVAALALVGGLVGLTFALAGGDDPAPGGGADSPALAGEAATPDAPAGEDRSEVGLPPGKEPPEEMTLVEINSDPPGAEAFVDGTMIGNTPVRLPRPEAGRQHEVVVKRSGYRNGEVRLTTDSPESVDVDLERESRPRRSSARRPERPRQVRRSSPAPAREDKADDEENGGDEQPPPEPSKKQEPMVTKEVVDPWAD
ncbi:MAG: protein kinase domain-containing protein [Myxococcota bacterium]